MEQDLIANFKLSDDDGEEDIGNSPKSIRLSPRKNLPDHKHQEALCGVLRGPRRLPPPPLHGPLPKMHVSGETLLSLVP